MMLYFPSIIPAFVFPLQLALHGSCSFNTFSPIMHLTLSWFPLWCLQSLYIVPFSQTLIVHLGPLCPLARLTVARPLAKPTPLPLCPLDLNIGAFLNISGTMKKRTWLPRMYTWSRWLTLPSRAVTVMSLSCTFILSSAGHESQRMCLQNILRMACYLLSAFRDRLGLRWSRESPHGSRTKLVNSASCAANRIIIAS